MRKKRYLFFILSLCFTGIFYFFSLEKSAPAFADKYCAFCDPVVLNNQKFYEDELVFALYTHKPILPGHCLVIPKRHVSRFEMLSNIEIEQIGEVIKKVNLAVEKVFGTSSYLLLQKNGLEVGQTVPHVHFHYIPRKTGDDSSLRFIIKMYLANIKKPINSFEMNKITENLKEEMN